MNVLAELAGALLTAGGYLIAALTVHSLVGLGSALIGAGLALFGWELGRPDPLFDALDEEGE